MDEMRPAAPSVLVRLARGAACGGLGLLDALLPPSCLTCDEPVQRVGQLCAACFGRTSFITHPLCQRCGVPFTHGAQGGRDALCQPCRTAPPLYERARAALRYDAQARRLILPFKHADRTETAAALAPFMARAGAALLAEADLLVPVPLHWRRRLARRYNQSALLALALGRLTRRPVLVDALVRRHATATLAGGRHSAAERERIMAEAIAVRPRRATRLAGARVLLIDDVLTSGATANACVAALHSAGVCAVDVLAAARVPDPRLD